jgi:hypothetical protein
MTRPLRLGVYYDGGWYSKLFRWLVDESKWRAAPDFAGVHDLLRWYCHLQFNAPLDHVTLAQAHYVLGRRDGLIIATPQTGHYSSTAWDITLRREGIVRHDVDISRRGTTVGVSVQVALLVQEHIKDAALDMVALIAGHEPYLPLVRSLTSGGIPVIIPSLDVGCGVYTDSALTAATPHHPGWAHLLDSGLGGDYPLRYPFTTRARSDTRRSPVSEDGYRYGTINRWERDHGFLTDRSGLRWFVHRNDIAGGHDRLPQGQHVRFNGRPRPMPGRSYPQARTVTAIDQ